MSVITNLMIGLIALLHFYFLLLEMFLWSKPLGQKVFRLSADQARSTKVLAANQGLYNGFLAVGLLWGIFSSNSYVAFQFKSFFLGCVIVAGTYGAYSVNKKIFFIQAVPAATALAFLLLKF